MKNNKDDNMQNVMILTTEEGEYILFEFLDWIDYDGRTFIVLLPTDENTDEVVILEAHDAGPGMAEYISIEDEKTENAVFDLFKTRFQGVFRFVDE